MDLDPTPRERWLDAKLRIVSSALPPTGYTAQRPQVMYRCQCRPVLAPYEGVDPVSCR
jgi:hypothetical protein